MCKLLSLKLDSKYFSASWGTNYKNHTQKKWGKGSRYGAALGLKITFPWCPLTQYTNILHTSSVKLPFLGRKHFGAMCLHAFDLHTYRLTDPPHFNKKKLGPVTATLVMADSRNPHFHTQNELLKSILFFFFVLSLIPLSCDYLFYSFFVHYYFSLLLS